MKETTDEITIPVKLSLKLAEELRCLAGKVGSSTYVSDLVRQHLHGIRLRQLLKEMDEEFGPVPPEVQAEVDAPMWPDTASTVPYSTHNRLLDERPR